MSASIEEYVGEVAAQWAKRAPTGYAVATLGALPEAHGDAAAPVPAAAAERDRIVAALQLITTPKAHFAPYKACLAAVQQIANPGQAPAAAQNTQSGTQLVLFFAGLAGRAEDAVSDVTPATAAGVFANVLGLFRGMVDDAYWAHDNAAPGAPAPLLVSACHGMARRLLNSFSDAELQIALASRASLAAWLADWRRVMQASFDGIGQADAAQWCADDATLPGREALAASDETQNAAAAVAAEGADSGAGEDWTDDEGSDSDDGEPMQLPPMAEVEDTRGNLFKAVVTEGDAGGGSPPPGARVTVHYVGRLASNGKQFDASRDGGMPFTFKIGAGEVIKGWDAGVATMRKGETALLKCLPRYGYGKGGAPPEIPGNATLVFEVELLEWKKPRTATRKRA
jgi:FKBP-type peptidyl-prolyl cis-trans isomerase